MQEILFEGRKYSVVKYRVALTSEGTAWRMITERKTLVVIPCQTAAAPAGAPICLPHLIHPVFCGIHDKHLARLLFSAEDGDSVEKSNSDDHVKVEERFRAHLARYGIKQLSKAKLNRIIEFTGPPLRKPSFSGADFEILSHRMRRLLKKIEEVSGRDISGLVKTDYSKSFARTASEWAKRVAESHRITHRSAFNLFLSKVRYVGISFCRVDVPIDTVVEDVHDGEDKAVISRETRIDPLGKPPRLDDARQLSSASEDAEEKFDLRDYGTQQEIIREILGGSRDLWDSNRADLEKEVPPYLPPKMKRALYHMAKVRKWFKDKGKIRF